MWQDLATVLRSIQRHKFFSLVVLIVFSLGIASTSTIFSAMDAVLLNPPAFPEVDRMLMIQGAEKKQTWDNVSPAIFAQLRSRSELFSQVVGIRKSIYTVTHVPTPDQVFGFAVSGNLLSVLRAKPLLGRMLMPADDQPGAPRVVVLSDQARKQLFNGDRQVVGKSMQIDGDLYTVAGVMPPDFALPNPNAGGMLWIALRLTAAEVNSENARVLQVFALRKTGVDPDEVQQRLDRLAETFAHSTQHASLRLRATTLSTDANTQQKLTLWLAMGMVCGLLLIGCANLSSLLLARATSRQRDFAIRMATGASRWQLIRHSVLEILLLALASLVVAAVLTNIAVHLIRDHLTTVGAGMPNLAAVQLNHRSLLFSFALALLCAILCGIFPALTATSLDLASSLRETGTFKDTRGQGKRFLHVLIAAEAAVALLLLLTSGLLLRSLTLILTDDHGLRRDHVLTLRLPTGAWQSISKKRTLDERKANSARYLALLRKAQTMPGVEAAALASSLPLSHTLVSTAFSYHSERVLVTTQAVTADYFKVMGIPLLAGRTFKPDENAPLLIVNQAFARKYLGGQDPVGQFVLSEDGTERSQIIGEVKDSPSLDVTEPLAAETYADFSQTNLTPFLTGLVVRTQGKPESLIRALRQMVALESPDQPVVQVKTLQTLIDENIWQPRFSAWLSTFFAALAVGLCGVGIYGVVGFTAASREREFGIRRALGAGRANLFRLMATQSLLPVVTGCCGGLLAFYWTSQWLSSLLYKTSPLDAVNALLGIGIFLVVALLAVSGPVLRASRVDPAVTLRHH